MKLSETKMIRARATQLRRTRYPSGQTRLLGLFICPVCKKKRWVDSANVRRPKFSGRCQICHGKIAVKRAHLPEFRPRGPNNHNYKRGYWITPSGYVELTLAVCDPRKIFTERTGGKILQHRLVMSQKLGRRLEIWEHVHHLNGNKKDNRVENLELLPNGIHSCVTALRREIKRLRCATASCPGPKSHHV